MLTKVSLEQELIACQAQLAANNGQIFKAIRLLNSVHNDYILLSAYQSIFYQLIKKREYSALHKLLNALPTAYFQYKHNYLEILNNHLTRN